MHVHRLRAKLLPATVLILGACAPVLHAWPPQAPHATGLDPVPRGDVELGMSASGMTMDGDFVPNVASGWLNGRLGFGLSKTVDLSLAGGTHYLGPTGGLTLGYTPLVVEDEHDLGLQLGLSGSWSQDSYRPVVGEDEEGNPVRGDRIYYDYATVAPSLAVRGRKRIYKRLWVPVRLRTSYSRALLTGGEPDLSMPQEVWVEASTALHYEGRGWEAGLGLTAISPMGLSEPLEPWLMADLSLGITLGNWFYEPPKPRWAE